MSGLSDLLPPPLDYSEPSESSSEPVNSPMLHVLVVQECDGTAPPQ